MEKKKTKRPKAKPTIDVAIAQKDIQIAVYAREIEAQAGEIRALRSELGKAKAASDSERASYSAKMKDFQGKMTSLESEMDRLGKVLSEERAAAHAAQGRFLSEIESMQKGNADAMARLTVAESEKEAFSADKAKLLAENARMAAECRAAREALDRSLADAEFLRKGNADAMARLTAAESGKEALSADKAKLLAENARMAEECCVTHDALDRSLSDAEALREGNKDLVSRLETAEAEKSALSSTNAKLAADSNRLEKELGMAKNESAQFKQKADSRFAEIASLKAKLKKAQDAEAAARRRADSAERNLSAANRSLRACMEREDARRLVKRFHRLVKAVMPYGMVCTWKRMAYGIVEDKPLFYYPGLMKRTRRIAKFLLPYFAVAVFRRDRRAAGQA